MFSTKKIAQQPNEKQNVKSIEISEPVTNNIIKKILAKSNLAFNGKLTLSTLHNARIYIETDKLQHPTKDLRTFDDTQEEIILSVIKHYYAEEFLNDIDITKLANEFPINGLTIHILENDIQLVFDKKSVDIEHVKREFKAQRIMITSAVDLIQKNLYGIKIPLYGLGELKAKISTNLLVDNDNNQQTKPTIHIPLTQKLACVLNFSEENLHALDQQATSGMNIQFKHGMDLNKIKEAEYKIRFDGNIACHILLNSTSAHYSQPPALKIYSNDVSKFLLWIENEYRAITEKNMRIESKKSASA